MIEIPLTRGLFALIDADDLPLVIGKKWFAHCDKKNGKHYAYSNGTVAGGKRTTLIMHRVILGHSGIVDHVNGNGLDNRRSNIRPATSQQNQANRGGVRKTKTASRYRGVTLWRANGRKSKWRARIFIGAKAISLGYFSDELSAARAYDEAAKKHFGEFAQLNLTVRP